MEEYWVGCTLQLKIAFFQLYLSLIGNYLSFYKEKQAHEPPSMYNVFDLEKYLDSLTESSRGFMEEIIKTQHFAEFIERSYPGLHESNELTYFIKGVRTVQLEGKVKLVEDLKKIFKRLLLNYKKV